MTLTNIYHKTGRKMIIAREATQEIPAIQKIPTTQAGKKDIARDSTKNVGRRICAIRNNYTLTQQQMADKMRISRNYLSEIENGKRVPPGPLLVAFEALFMTNIEWITKGAGEMLKNRSASEARANQVEHEDIITLLTGFRSMSDDGRKKLMNILKVFMLVDEQERAS